MVTYKPESDTAINNALMMLQNLANLTRDTALMSFNGVYVATVPGATQKELADAYVKAMDSQVRRKPRVKYKAMRFAIEDMPKLESPFVRNSDFVVTPRIAPRYEWVFEDNTVTCQEKLDGTCVSIVIQGGKITRVFNRLSDQDFLSNGPIMQAVRNAYERGYCSFTDGQYFGEAVGPGIQGNLYRLNAPIWLPFNSYFSKHLTYKSWGKYPKDFDTISVWLRDDLFSLFWGQKHGKSEVAPKPEGIVFHHPDGRMAKLRRDMFDWFEGKRHRSGA